MIKEKLNEIKKLIRLHEIKYARPKGAVKLLAASKGQSIEKIREAFSEGQLSFGENYLQEALLKIKSLNEPSIEWHFIGEVQSNKTKKIATHFAWVESVASDVIAKRLNEQRPSNLPPINILIEVNLNQEKSKAGLSEIEIRPLLNFCLKLSRLKVRGLMSIPEPALVFSKQREHFHRLFELFQTLRQEGFALDILSMGMSQDFEAAIAEGSTEVRIGTAIFGERKK
ncbi:MAG: YggS family pyridoxal phosphate-dependent enzyme [Gammaproteobacteria bacterium]|nr:YggS family pyridoxal phosphate-dependent enzyme [Gammaproteobacteria bacterium]